MPMKDYQDALTRLQKGLASGYQSSPTVLNTPGQSLMCKVDPDYYLALEPIFTEILARWAISFPQGVLETLVHTGNLVFCKPLSTHIIPLTLSWGGNDYEVQAAFLPASFVDRALKLYAGVQEPLPVSDLRIRADERAAVEAFFGEMSPLASVAYL
ncbi:MAG TPA: hypothetical protein VN419_12955 [Humidesulfovibrio sp.]|uniref:hypothetical protein n=1 Tax=Humidesulfovibrio sp. TaxID=2910988 RepID=UPI002B7A4358|nr:hypothetical protein [Humidesulfovibrio sp.]HWR04907.1 hypothetical protein [Humidesulfovibrio sp.]